jgi:lipoteichoic acid synthase
MKKFLPLLFIFSALVLKASEKNSSSVNPIIEQEIHYLSLDAAKVYIVWGINNWNIPETGLLREDSFIKDNLVYTPMKKTPFGFVAKLDVPAKTVIDFDFRITQGPAKKPIDIWDVNKLPKKDYHIVASGKTILLKSTVIARPKEALSILDYTSPILLLSILFLLAALIFIRYFRDKVIFPGPLNIIFSSSIILIIYLVILRSSVTGLSWDLYLNPSDSILKILWAGFYDVLFVSIIASVFLFFLKFFNTPKMRQVLIGLFLSIAFLSLIGGILNIKVVEIIGKPFDYPWLYYSDFLKSADSRAAMASNMSLAYIFKSFLICLSAFFSGITVSVLGGAFIRQLRMRYVLRSSLAAAILAYLIIAPGAIKRHHWEYGKLANPIVAFAGSLNPFSGDPELFTMAVDDSLKFNFRRKREITHNKKTNSKIKNVVLFVMESTPAEYVQPYSTNFKITPELEKISSESMIFDNIYAHAPSTNNSLISILGSIYPWLSYNSITKEYPDIKIPTISSELNKKGFRTAYFNSADNRYQNANSFLANRNFDKIKDCNTLNCVKHFEYTDAQRNYLDGKDDECTAEELTSWIRQDPEKPFFAMMWTYQTHYPYFFSGEEKKYTSADPDLNRYLNAVHHSDFILGKILAELKRDGLSESTLVVVVGDHGEAFGRHDQTAHASGIYEENLHVPCIFINPAFKGEHVQTIGGLIDLAPTIVDQLGYAPADQWQGKDLLTEEENSRVYFFTPWADFLFGYREGNKKFIFNATKNLTEIYDLKKDPFETRNIAMEFPEKATVCHQRIAGWVQSHNQFMSLLLAKKK